VIGVQVDLYGVRGGCWYIILFVCFLLVGTVLCILQFVSVRCQVGSDLVVQRCGLIQVVHVSTVSCAELCCVVWGYLSSSRWSTC